jgi:hypothetical protein
MLLPSFTPRGGGPRLGLHVPKEGDDIRDVFAGSADELWVRRDSEAQMLHQGEE